MPEIWGELPKAVDDPQTITEAVAEAISDHNADPEAHLGEDEALEAHRDSDVIDHPAESIPNDKLFNSARAYIAIVDPSSDEDYDTISGAVAYAIANGGGNILITPGEHFIGEGLVLPSNINIIGTDRDTCIITCGVDADDALLIPAQSIGNNNAQRFESLTFNSDSGYCIRQEVFDDIAYLHQYFLDCYFTGDGYYISTNCEKTVIRDCKIGYIGNGALDLEGWVGIENLYALINQSSGTVALFSDAGVYAFDLLVNITNSYIQNTGSSAIIILPDDLAEPFRIEGCRLIGLGILHTGNARGFIGTTDIFFKSSGYLNITSTYVNIMQNYMFGSSGNNIRLSSASDRCIVLGNNAGSSITNSGTNNVLANNITS